MVLLTPSNVVSNKESAKPALSGGTGVGGCGRTVGQDDGRSLKSRIGSS